MKIWMQGQECPCTRRRRSVTGREDRRRHQSTTFPPQPPASSATWAPEAVPGWRSQRRGCRHLTRRLPAPLPWSGVGWSNAGQLPLTWRTWVRYQDLHTGRRQCQKTSEASEEGFGVQQSHSIVQGGDVVCIEGEDIRR